MLLHLVVTAAVVSLSRCEEILDGAIPNRSVKIDKGTSLVLVGARHGNRLPARFLNDSSRTWGYEGATELTQFGKREAFGIGKELREFVGRLVGNNYLPDEAAFYTSSANRCQMTLQGRMECVKTEFETLLAGFYPPDTFAEWNAALDWTPVPYTIDDPMLRMYAVGDCPRNTQAWEPIRNDELPQLRKLKEQNASLLEYIANHTNWEASINSAADLADNLAEIELYGAEYPGWIERPTLEGYDKERLVREVVAFREKPQKACAEHEPCRRLMAGVWLQHIITSLANAALGQQLPRIIIYASHTEVILSLMKLTHINRHEVPPAAGFVIEFRREPNASIRILAHDPVDVDEHVIYQADYGQALSQIADRNRWVIAEDFISLVKGEAIPDWEQACGRKTAHNAFRSSGVSSLATSSLCLLAMYFLFH